MNEPPSVRRVSETELRRIYIESGFDELIASGELASIIEFDRPCPTGVNQPHGTRSQIVAYLNADEDVVLRLHRYLRPDGSFGASGLPDPKYIRLGGIIYKQARSAVSQEPN